jgi:hypothetical protein
VLSDPDGKYKVPARITKATRFRVTSAAVGSLEAVESTSRRVELASQFVWATAERVCRVDDTCADKGKVSGYVRPVRENRVVRLQIRTSSGWKYLSSPRDTTDSGGNFAMEFGIKGWSQWRAQQLRAVAQSYNGASYAISAPMTFMKGPNKLGKNVLRVDVAGGRFPTTKGVDYTGYATLTRKGGSEVLINRARLDKFGVRGSTTAGYPKKPYNLRFDKDPGTGNEVFGMKADKRWTLLAMYADQSYVRDKTALDLGRKLTAMSPGAMKWNPDSEYVELFVNSQYMGAYLMVEKVDIDDDKVDVGNNTGMLMETDMDKVSDPRKGFMSSRGRLVFAFKEPDTLGAPDGITSTKLSKIKSKVAQVENYLYTTNRSKYPEVIDKESALDFYLAVEYFKDIDADFWRSKYFSWDMARDSSKPLRDGKLHFGPLWDFDKSVGNVDATNPGTAFTRSYRGWAANGTGVGKSNRVTYHTHWFAQLWKTSAFRSPVKARWNDPETKNAFWRAWRYEVDANKNLIGQGAYNDRARWAGAAKLYRPKGSTYEAEVNYVKSWLKNRFTWIDGQL